LREKVARAPDEGKLHISPTLIRPRVPRVHLLPQAGEGLALTRRPFTARFKRQGDFAVKCCRHAPAAWIFAGGLRHNPVGETGRFFAPNSE